MKWLNLLFLLIFESVAFGATRGITVDENGVIVYPQGFAEKNNIASTEVICVRVDMFSGGTDVAYRWSDAELKVLDADGKLLYFATTCYNDYVVYHKNDGTWDSACVIYYYIAGTKYAYAGQCSNPKRRHEVSESQQLSIGGREQLDETIGTGIVAIEFFPNLDGKINGKSIREIFLNPENTVIVSRKNQTTIERTYNDNRVWRPTIPQYYKR